MYRIVAKCSIIFILFVVTSLGLAFGQSTTLTLLTVNDVYEITPVQGKGGLAELMTLLRAERATATHHLTTVQAAPTATVSEMARIRRAAMDRSWNMANRSFATIAPKFPESA